MKPDVGIEPVRRARTQISESVDHDPGKLVERYIEMQKRFQDRLQPRPNDDEHPDVNEAAA
jgi:hypothetical protein